MIARLMALALLALALGLGLSACGRKGPPVPPEGYEGPPPPPAPERDYNLGL